MCAKEYFFKLSFRSTTLPFIPFCLLQWLISIFLLCSHVAETGLPHVAQVPRRVADEVRQHASQPKRFRKRLCVNAAWNCKLVGINDTDGDAARAPQKQLRLFSSSIDADGSAQRPPELENFAVSSSPTDTHSDILNGLDCEVRTRVVQPRLASIVVRRRHQRQQRHDDAKHGPVEAGLEAGQWPRPHDSLARSLHSHG